MFVCVQWQNSYKFSLFCQILWRYQRKLMKNEEPKKYDICVRTQSGVTTCNLVSVTSEKKWYPFFSTNIFGESIDMGCNRLHKIRCSFPGNGSDIRIFALEIATTHSFIHSLAHMRYNNGELFNRIYRRRRARKCAANEEKEKKYKQHWSNAAAAAATA